MTRIPLTSIDVTPEAAAFIREKGGTVMLRSTVKYGCCGGRVELVKAEIGEPRPEDDFEHFDIDGLSLSAERGLIDDLGTPIRIGLDKLFKMRAPFVEATSSR